MWVPLLADPDWVAATLRTHHRLLRLSAPSRVERVDVRISNPHKPSSARCHGWATYRVYPADPSGTALLLLQAGAAGAPPEPHGGTAVPGMHLLVWRFPSDPRLPALRELVDPAHAAPRLPYRRAGLDPARHHDLALDVVRWQPGASATLRYRLGYRLDGGAAAVAGLYCKILADGGVAALDKAHRQLYEADPGRPRVAEPLGADETLGVLWTREAPGTPLLDLLRAGPQDQRDRAAESVAQTLLLVHHSRVAPAEATSLAAHAAEAYKKAAKLARAHRDLTDAAAAVAAVAREAAALGDGHTVSAPLHGDCHVEQFLDDRGRPILLDLDSMVRGEPEVDLSEFAVDLCQRGLPVVTVDRLLERLFAAYGQGSRGGPDPARLRAYAAAEFLNRCYRHLRRSVPGWQQAAATELARFPDVMASIDRALEGPR